MSRIVHPSFPVERLPEEFRAALGNSTHVRLTIEDIADDEALLSELEAMLDQGMQDIEAGRTFTYDEVQRSLNGRFTSAKAAE
jgi:predicted transcriptional regulator